MRRGSMPRRRRCSAPIAISSSSGGCVRSSSAAEPEPAAAIRVSALNATSLGFRATSNGRRGGKSWRQRRRRPARRSGRRASFFPAVWSSGGGEVQDEQSTVRCENASPLTSPHWGEVAKRSERERGIKRCQYQSVSFPLTRLSRFARSAPSPRRGEGKENRFRDVSAHSSLPDLIRQSMLSRTPAWTTGS